jgi:jumonji domain-containing protein 7
MHVPYLSHQNDSLRDEFTPVKQDVPPEIEWASAAFGTPPDATNIWIGDGRAVSSVHKDHYENMYQLRSHQ